MGRVPVEGCVVIRFVHRGEVTLSDVRFRLDLHVLVAVLSNFLSFETFTDLFQLHQGLLLVHDELLFFLVVLFLEGQNLLHLLDFSPPDFLPFFGTFGGMLGDLGSGGVLGDHGPVTCLLRGLLVLWV